MLQLHRARLLPTSVCSRCFRRMLSDAKVFAEGDIVLLRHKRRSDHQGILTKPLKSGVSIANHHGVIRHDALIGKCPRDSIQVEGKKTTEYRITEPTLDEYVRLTPRIVTPIYPNDANIIVSLLDLHVEPPTAQNASSPPLEILEAGTGHGSLTLHLARAIAAANPPPPPTFDHPPVPEDAPHPLEDATYESTTTDHTAENSLEAWKHKRKAIVHTLDASARHSRHAHKVVNGFRRGLYAPHIDFHVGDVSEFIKSQLAKRAKSATANSSSDTNAAAPFLSHVFLDLPSAESHLATVAQALRVDGVLAVFNPSITQIADCAKEIKKAYLPFTLQKVVELKGNETIRQWDVRVTQLKAARRAAAAASKGQIVEEEEVDSEEGLGDEGSSSDPDAEGNLVDQAKEHEEDVARRDQELENAENEDEWKLVCRPKTGLTMGVGGFVGIWRRNRDNKTEE